MTQSQRPSPISATVDFDADGVQHGFLRLPYSRDDAAWGSVMIPVTVVKNGKGPTALLTGANHGDDGRRFECVSHAHSPVNFGARFSMKAATPSA